MVSPGDKPNKPYFRIELDGNKRKAHFTYSTTLPLRAGDVKDVVKAFSDFVKNYEEQARLGKQ